MLATASPASNFGNLIYVLLLETSECFPGTRYPKA
jgi:hypothetical protein